MLKVHLCCGPQDFGDAWMHVDAIPFGHNKVCDLNGDWDFAEPGTVDYILCKDGFEHMASPEHFLQQAAKVLAPGGKLEIWVPHFKNPSAYRLTHRTYYSWSFFDVFPEAHDVVKGLKVFSNKIYVARKDSKLFALTHAIANRWPKWYERMFYVSNVEAIFQKLP